MTKYRVTLDIQEGVDRVPRTAVVSVPERAGTLVIIAKAISALRNRGHNVSSKDVVDTNIAYVRSSEDDDSVS